MYWISFLGLSCLRIIIIKQLSRLYLQIVIHEPGEIPLVSELSYGLKTGAETIMTLHKKIVRENI